MSFKKLGIIAGSGEYPRVVAARAKEEGFDVYCVALSNDFIDDLKEVSSEIVYLSPGELGKIKDFFIKHRLKRIALTGKIEKRIMYNTVPDTEALRLLNKISDHRDNSILQGICEYFLDYRIEVCDSTLFVKDLIIKEGLIAGRALDSTDWDEIAFGYRMAKGIAALDIGQTVVVKNRAVCASESIEGTDETIRRGARYGGCGVYIIKVSKPDQDMRFDLPVIGKTTISLAIENKASCIAIESLKSLFFQREDSIDLANKHKLSIIGLPYNWDYKWR
ncbi:MAG: UDP-2,3-diacylglucosamine diphosphatase LpxI [Candidatus Hydrogenedentota bacterium]